MNINPLVEDSQFKRIKKQYKEPEESSTEWVPELSTFIRITSKEWLTNFSNVSVKHLQEDVGTKAESTYPQSRASFSNGEDQCIMSAIGDASSCDKDNPSANFA